MRFAQRSYARYADKGYRNRWLAHYALTYAARKCLIDCPVVFAHVGNTPVVCLNTGNDYTAYYDGGRVLFRIGKVTHN